MGAAETVTPVRTLAASAGPPREKAAGAALSGAIVNVPLVVVAPSPTVTPLKAVTPTLPLFEPGENAY